MRAAIAASIEAMAKLIAARISKTLIVTSPSTSAEARLGGGSVGQPQAAGKRDFPHDGEIAN
jgi:hypothetical protein